MPYSSIVAVFSLLFIAFPAVAQQQIPFVIRNFEKQEYKAESQNWSLNKALNGFIYAANNAGLLEYDGVEWSFYPSPSGNVLRSVAVDQQGRIYTSGYRELGYWQKNEKGALLYTSLNPLAEDLFSQNEEFWNTVIIGENVYFHSFTSLFVYDGLSFRVVRPGNLINSISKSGTTLLVALQDEGLFQVKDTLLVPYLVDAEIRNHQIQFCLTLQDSSLLIGTASNGLFRFKEDRLFTFIPQWTPYFSVNTLNRGAITLEGNIVLGTLLDGVTIFDKEGNFLHRINHENGLQNNTILGIHCDEEDNLWIAMDRGVDFISIQVDPSYTLYNYEEIGAVYSAAIYKGDLYLCTNQGVFYRNWENDKERFRFIPGTQGQAWSCDVFDGQLIVGHNTGTYRIENHTAKQLSTVTGGFSMIRDPLKHNLLVQSTYTNIVFYEREGANWQYAYQLNEFQDLIRYIQLDYFNNIWASHMHRGIYRLRLDDRHEAITGSTYYGEEVFGKDYDIQVFTISNRIVFSTGEHFYTYNDLSDSIILYEQLNQALGVHARAHRVVYAGEGHYWFLGKSGIGLFRVTDEGISKIREYPAELFSEHLVAGYENIIPISRTEGLLCLDNGYAILRANLPDRSADIGDKQLLVKQISIRGRSGISEQLSLDQHTIRIPYNKNSLSLGFAFPHFSPGLHSFQSYVEGLDVDWSAPLDKPVFEFTRIPAGEYTIRVRAFNQWKRSSEETRINLLVENPWYLSQASIIVYLLLMIVLFLSTRYLLLRRIRAREQRIKNSKEQELVRLRNEKLNADLSFKSQELANSTMSIIKKNEFLMELKEILKAQKDDLGTRYPEKYYSRIIRKIDNNISSIDDWNVFEIHFEKAHEKFLQKLTSKYPHLSHSDLRLCAYLRMNLSSKEIAPLLRISYRGVENHRYRLRKKLLLKKDVNLTDFILSL